MAEPPRIRPAYREGKNQVPDRANAYVSTKDGRRYYASPQVPGAGNVLGQTSFVDTTPTFLLDLDSLGRSIIVSRLRLSQIVPIAGGPIEVVVAIDNISRHSSGGTLITPQSARADSPNAAEAKFYTNPVAKAPGSVRYLDGLMAAASSGAVIEIDFEDGICIPSTGALLIYTFAPSIGPTWKYNLEWIEEDSED